MKPWVDIMRRVIRLLDTIDLISEMEDNRENLSVFMDRLEQKYPFNYLQAESLFDMFSMDCFIDYLTISAVKAHSFKGGMKGDVTLF